MAGQLRTAQTVTTPKPLMQIRVNVPTRQLPAPREGRFHNDRQAQRRLEVLHRVDARLRAIRREVEERQRYEMARDMVQDVLGAESVRTTETQTETPTRTEDIVTHHIDSEGDDDECVMSMEQRMEAQHPVDDRLILHPTVFDELYTDTLETGRLVNDNRMERSKSLPSTWD